MNLRSTIAYQATLPTLRLNSIEAAGAEGAAGGGAGGASEGAGAGLNGSGGGGELPFYESFKNEAIRTSPSVQLFKDVESLAEGYVNLEKKLGVDPNRRLDLPADPKDEAAMRVIWGKLGMPEKPEGYGLTLADDANDADRKMLGSFLERAHKLGMPASMAKGTLEFWLEQVAAGKQAAADESVMRLHEGEAALKKEFGQAYETRLREIGRLCAKYGDPEIAAELNETKIGNYPNLAKMLNRIIERMAEPGGLLNEGKPEPLGGDVLTPAQASAQVKVIEMNPGLTDRNHPQHKALVAERSRLLGMAEPQT